jgi:hypothetical protein
MVGGIVCNRTFRISTVSRIPYFAYVSDVESERCWRGWQAYQPHYDVSLSRTLCSCSGTDTSCWILFRTELSYFHHMVEYSASMCPIWFSRLAYQAILIPGQRIFEGTVTYLQVMTPRREKRRCRNLWGPWSYGGPNSNFRQEPASVTTSRNLNLPEGRRWCGG